MKICILHIRGLIHVGLWIGRFAQKSTKILDFEDFFYGFASFLSAAEHRFVWILDFSCSRAWIWDLVIIEVFEMSLKCCNNFAMLEVY